MKKTGLSWLWLSVTLIAMDLFSKFLVIQRFEFGESINLLPIFNLTYARNYGAAFSFLADHSGWQKYLFLGLAIIISLALVIMLARNPSTAKWQNAA